MPLGTNAVSERNRRALPAPVLLSHKRVSMLPALKSAPKGQFIRVTGSEGIECTWRARRGFVKVEAVT